MKAVNEGCRKVQRKRRMKAAGKCSENGSGTGMKIERKLNDTGILKAECA